MVKQLGIAKAYAKAILGLKWDAAGTLLYGVVDALLNRVFMRLRGRKALIMLTDGEDNDPRRFMPKNATYSGPSCRETPCATYKDNMRDAEEAEVLIYSVKFEGGHKRPHKSSDGRLEVEGSGEEYLNELARKTGGRFYDADREDNLMQTFNSIASELRNQYSLGFYAKPSTQPSQRRELQVRVGQPGLAVRARSSYIYFPPKVRE